MIAYVPCPYHIQTTFWTFIHISYLFIFSELNSSLTNNEKNVGGSIYAYWNGTTVTIEIAGAIPTEAVSNTSTVVAVLPSEVPRPSTTKYGVISCGGNSNRFVLLAIQANGNMLVYNYSGASTSYLYGFITFLR